MNELLSNLQEVYACVRLGAAARGVRPALAPVVSTIPLHDAAARS